MRTTDRTDRWSGSDGQARAQTGGDIPDPEQLPRTPLPAAKVLIGEELYSRLLRFTDLHPKAQVRVVNELIELGLPVEATLRDAAIRGKIDDPRYNQKFDGSFRDPTIWKLERGQQVEIWAETSSTGVSREQTEFLSSLADKGELILLDDKHPQIRALELIEGTYLFGNSHEPSSAAGLLKLLMEHPDHPAFGTQRDADTMAQHLRGAHFSLAYVKGTVLEAPSGSNEGLIKLDDNRTVEMCAVRLVNVIGVDQDMLLNRQDHELYKNQRVWVYYKRTWKKATVEDPDEYNNAGTVVCDEVVHTNLDNHQGKGLTFHRALIGIDVVPSQEEELLDPPDFEHPLEKYPHIERDQCIKFNKDGRSTFGIIARISILNSTYTVTDSDGNETSLDFGEHVTILDRERVDAFNPTIKPGNIVATREFQNGSPVVYKILAVGDDSMFVRRVDRAGCRRCSTLPNDFYRAGPQSKLVFDRDQEHEKLQARFPWIAAFDLDSDVLIYSRMTFMDHDGVTRTGKPLDLQTFPAHIEILIEKTPQEIRADNEKSRGQADHYHRYCIKAEDIISWEKS